MRGSLSPSGEACENKRNCQTEKRVNKTIETNAISMMKANDA